MRPLDKGNPLFTIAHTPLCALPYRKIVSYGMTPVGTRPSLVTYETVRWIGQTKNKPPSGPDKPPGSGTKETIVKNKINLFRSVCGRPFDRFLQM